MLYNPNSYKYKQYLVGQKLVDTKSLVKQLETIAKKNHLYQDINDQKITEIEYLNSLYQLCETEGQQQYIQKCIDDYNEELKEKEKRSKENAFLKKCNPKNAKIQFQDNQYFKMQDALTKMSLSLFNDQ